MTLSGSNGFTGVTTIEAGTLSLGSANALAGGGSVTFGGGTLQFTSSNTTDYSARIANSTSGAIAIDTNGQGVTFSGALQASNTGGLTKLGAGTLTLSGSNGFSGVTTIAAGTLSLGSANALAGGGSVTFGGGTLQFGTSGVTYTNAITGSGSSVILFDSAANSGTLSGDIYASNTGGLTKVGVGVVTLSGSNGFTGVTTISAGTLSLGSANALAGGGSVTFGGGTLQFGTSEVTYTNAITGSGTSVILLDSNTNGGTLSGNIYANNTGGLTKVGAGTLSLSGSNSYSGVTAVGTGVLRVMHGFALGATTDGTTVSDGAALELFGGITIGAEALTLAGTGLGGNGALRNISGNNTYGGPITLGAATSIQSDAGTLTLDVTSGNAVSGAFGLTFAGGGNIAVSAPLALGGGGLIKAGTGLLVLSGSNVFTGGLTLNAGTVRLGNSAALNSGAPNTVTFGSGVPSGTTLQLNGNAVTVSGVVTDATVGSPVIENGSATSGTLTVNQASGTSTFAGVMQDGAGGGSLSLVKSGTGILALLGANTFTGATSVTAGTVQLVGAGALTSGNIAVGSGATLDVTGVTGGTWSVASGQTLTGAGTLSGTTTLVSGAKVVPYLATGFGTLNTSSVTLNGEIRLRLGASSSGDQLVVTGGLTLGGASTLVILDNGGANALGSLGAGTYVLLTVSGTFSGTFGTFTQSVTGGTQTLTYEANRLLLVVASSGVWTNGTTNNLWDSAGNWAGGVVPGTGVGSRGLDDATFGSGVTAGTVTLATARTQLRSLSFDAANGTGYHLARSVGTEELWFYSSSGTAALSVNGGTHSIAVPIVLESDLGITVSQGTSRVTVSAVISGTSGQAVVKSGSGVLALSASNTFTGGMRLNAGTVQVGNDGALGSGTLVLAGGKLSAEDAVTARTLSNAVNLTGDVALGDSVNSAALTFSGNVLLGGSYTVNVASGVTLGGVLSDGGSGYGWTKSGTGTLLLSGGNTFSGPLSVSAGTLRAGSTSAFGVGVAVSLANTAGANLELAGFNNTIGSLSGGGALGGDVDLGSGVLTLSGNGSGTTYAGVISGSGGITKSGSAPFIVTGNNTFTGLTTLGAGILRLGGSNALAGGGSVTFSGGTLQFGTSGATYTNAITGSGTSVILLDSNTNSGTLSGNIYANNTGGLTKLGEGAVTLSGSNGFTGVTTIEAGTLALGSANALAGGGSVTFSGGTLQFGTSGVTYTNAITGSGASVIRLDSNTNSGTFSGNIYANNTGGLTKLGSGAVTLSGSNGFTGVTTIAAGTLALGSGNALAGGGSVTFSGGTLQFSTANTVDYASRIVGSTGVVGLDTNNRDVAFHGDLVASNTGGLGKYGAGTLTLAGSNGYTGTTFLVAGTLRLGTTNALGGGGNLTFGGGTLQFTAGNTGEYGSRVVNSGAAILLDTNGQNVAWSGNIAGSNTGGLIKNGSGDLTLSGTNSYTGPTYINSGTLTLSDPNAIAAGGLIVFAGGTLRLGVGNMTDYAVGFMFSTAGSVAVDTNGQNITFNGDISSTNTGGFTKYGVGTLTLSGSNGYTGGTRIDVGTLRLGSANAIGGSALTFGGGSLQFGVNEVSFANLITGSGPSVVALDSNGVNGTLSGNIDATNTGGLTKSGSGVVTLSGSNAYTGITTIGSGTLNLGSTNALAGGGSVRFAGGTLQFGVNGAAYSNQIAGSGGSVIQMDSNGVNGIWSGSIDASNTGGLTKSGAGVVTLSGSNAYTGFTTIASGTLNLGSTNAIAGGGSVQFSGGAIQLGVNDASYSNRITGSGASVVLVDSIANNGTLSGVIDATNSGGFTKIGAGTLVLSGSNAYTGVTTVSQGVLQVRNTNALGAASDGTTVNSGASLELAGGIVSAAEALVLSGSGNGGRGALRNLSGNNTWTGGITLGADASIQSEAGTLLLDVASGSAVTGSFNLGVGGNGDVTVADALALGSGALEKQGTGTLRLNGSNTFTGGLVLHGGTVQLGNAGALNTSSPNSVSFGTGVVAGTRLQLNGNEVTLSGLDTAATPSSAVVENASTTNVTLTVAPGSGSREFGGVLQDGVGGGSLSLLKSGAGTWVLSGANTYTGDTSIVAGTLSLTGNGALVSGTISLASGAFLDVSGVNSGFTLGSGQTLTGAGTLHGSMTVASGAKLLPGTSGSFKTLTTGALTLNGELQLRVGGSFSSDRLVMEGALTLGATSLIRILDNAGANGLGRLGGGVYELLYASGGVTGRFGTFVPAVTSGGQALSYDGNRIYLSVGATTGIWIGNANDSLWNSGANWEVGQAPGMNDASRGVDSAYLFAGTAPLTITLDSTKTQLNVLEFGSTGSFGKTLVGSDATKELWLYGTARMAAMTVHGGEHKVMLPVVIESDLLITPTNETDVLEITAGISGTGIQGLVKQGSGTLVLSGASFYSGGTVLDSGTLRVGHNSALGTGTLTVNGGRLSGDDAVTARTLANAVILESDVTLGDATKSAALTFSGSMRLTGDRELKVESEVTLSAVIAAYGGTFGFTKSGSGLLTLTGSNTFTGETVVNGGTLRLAGSGMTLASALVGVASGRLELGGSGQLSEASVVDVSGGLLRYMEGISGAVTRVGTLKVRDNGVLETGANTFVGTGSTIRLEGGVTTVNNGGRLEDHHVVVSGGTNTVQAGGVFAVTAAQAGATGLELVGGGSVLLTIEGGATPGRLSLENAVKVDASGGMARIASTGSGVFAGQVDLNAWVRTMDVSAQGSATGLELQAAVVNGGILKIGNGALVLSGSNQLTLGVELQEGVLELGHSAALRGGGSLAFTGGTLRFGVGINEDVSGIMAPVAVGKSAWIDTNGQAVDFAAGLSGAGTLVKDGLGTLRLFAASQHQGGSVVKSGNLVLGVNDVLLSTGTVTASGGTLDLGTTLQTVGVVRLAGGSISGGTLNGARYEVESGSISTRLAGTGALLKETSGTVVVTQKATYTGDTTVNAGTLKLVVDDAVVASGTVKVSGGTLLFGATTQALNVLTVSSGAVVGGFVQAGTVRIDGGLLSEGSLVASKIEATAGTVSSMLSGSGTLVKTGPGTLILSGDNTLTGTTTISAGTLQLGNGGYTGLLGTGRLVNNSTLAFLYANGAVINILNDISGTGTVEYMKLNGAVGYTVNFGGQNQNTGGVILRDGVTFMVSSDASFGTGSEAALSAGVMLLGGTLKSTSSPEISSKRTIGISHFNVDGSGGGGFDVALGVTMTASARLFDAVPTESGDLIKYGDGELILANAANSYTGRTIVERGTVTVGDNVTNGQVGLGEVQLKAADTTLRIHPLGEMDLSAKVTGLGSLTVNGTGKVRLLADNDYNGTNVLSGTLQIGNGGMVGTLGLGPVLNDGLVLIKRNGVVNIASEMTGSGALRLSGSSGAVGADRLVVNLSRSMASTGEVEVTDATLHLSGTASVPSASRIKVQSGGVFDVSAVAGGYRVNAGQSLAGNEGVVKGTIVMAGTLAPGNSPGTLTLGGIQFASGSTYQVEVDQVTGLFDSIAISGSLAGTGRAELNGNGTVVVSPIGSLMNTGVYRILSAPEVDGEFAGISGGTALFSQRLVYGGTSGAEYVNLELRYAKFESYGIGKNGRSIGGYLDRFNGGGTPEMKAFVDDLGLTPTVEGVGVKMSEIGVNAYADTLTTSLRRMLDLGSSVGARMELVGMEVVSGPGSGVVGSGPSGWSGWTSGAASSMDREARGTEGFGGSHLDSQSAVLGVEMPLGPIRLGWVGATGTSRANFAMPNARVESDSSHMGLYGVAKLGRGYVDGLLMYGLVDNEAERTIGVPGFGRTAKASFESEEFLLRLGGGLQVMPAESAWEVSVNERISVAGVMQDSILETQGGALGVRTTAGRSVGLLNEVGMTVGRRFVVVRTPVLVRFRANWVHDFREGATLQASLLGAPAGAGMFGVESAPGEKDAVRMSGSVDIGLSERVGLRLGAEYELRRGAARGTLSISVGIEF